AASGETATREFDPAAPVSPLQTYCVLSTSEASRALFPLSSIPASNWMPPVGQVLAGAAPRIAVATEFPGPVLPLPEELPPPPPHAVIAAINANTTVGNKAAFVLMTPPSSFTPPS